MLFAKDRAAAVRELGVQKIPELLKTFGEEFINIIVPKLSGILSTDGPFYHKVSVIYALKVTPR